MATPIPPQDPITAILIAVTEIRGNLRDSLARLERHQGQLDSHSHTLIDHGERITALETTAIANAASDHRTYSARAVIWSALGVAVTAVSTVSAAFLAIHGGG